MCGEVRSCKAYERCDSVGSEMSLAFEVFFADCRVEDRYGRRGGEVKEKENRQR